MAKKSKKKKVITTTKKTAKKTITPAVSTRKGSATKAVASPTYFFNKDNYRLMLLGIGLIALGMLLMVGGSMPNAETWDPDLIYSPRRTVLAPIVILAGLIVEVYAIFKK